MKCRTCRCRRSQISHRGGWTSPIRHHSFAGDGVVDGNGHFDGLSAGCFPGYGGKRPFSLPAINRINHSQKSTCSTHQSLLSWEYRSMRPACAPVGAWLPAVVPLSFVRRGPDRLCDGWNGR